MLNEDVFNAFLEKEFSEKKYVLYFQKKYNDFSPELKEAFDSYVETGVIPDFSYSGYDINYISKKTFSSITRSFMYMDTIMKDEEYCKYFPHMSFGIK